MPTRIPDAQRAAIADAIRAGGKRNQIARDHHVSPSTVSKIAEEDHIDDAFDRTATARASEAKRIDNAAKRADLAELSVGDALKLRERMFGPSEQVVPSGLVVTLGQPTARDVRDFASAIQALAKTHMELDRHDSAAGHDDQKSMLVGIAEGLRAMQRMRDKS